MLRVHLPKPPELVLSRWDNATLTSEQIKYAAHDAAAGIRIYNALISGTAAAPPATPAAPELSLDDLETELRRLLSICDPTGAFAAAAARSPPRSASTSPASRTADALRRAGQPDRVADDDQPPLAPVDGGGDTGSIVRTCCVLLDVLHLMQRYEKGCSTTKDPLFGLFMRKLKEAIFIKNSDDMAMLERWLLMTRGMSKEDVTRMSSSYIHQRVATSHHRLSWRCESFRLLTCLTAWSAPMARRFSAKTCAKLVER